MYEPLFRDHSSLEADVGLSQRALERLKIDVQHYDRRFDYSPTLSIGAIGNPHTPVWRLVGCLNYLLAPLGPWWLDDDLRVLQGRDRFQDPDRDGWTARDRQAPRLRDLLDPTYDE